MDIPVIFQDQDIVVISKPAGMVVNNADSVKGVTVQSWFTSAFLNDAQIIDQNTYHNIDHNSDQNAKQSSTLNSSQSSSHSKIQSDTAPEWQSLVPINFDQTYGSVEDVFRERQGMVHRLDKDTSGVLVFAKNPGALVHLLAQFREREVSKAYVCLVHGKVQSERGVVRAPLGRAQGKDRKKFQVRSDGRVAESEYQILDYFPAVHKQDESPSYQQGFTLLKVWPLTGRTHQIRVHCKHIGHPLVGDATYTGKRRAKADKSWCKRHFLHASELTFKHPRTQEKITFQSPLSDDLVSILNSLASTS